MNYKSLLNRLYAINTLSGVKLGLQNMQRLCLAFDNPEKRFQSIHVAGTNGKGSVVSKIAKTYQESGSTVGLYTSPHISSFRERIRVNGLMIPEEDVERILNKIFAIVDEMRIPATFFEITTLLAFLYFAEKNVKVAVLETGLGGRLDATNVISSPLMCIITSIDFDHMELLGDTLEKIALEKAGILKRGSPVVIGPRVPKEIIQSVSQSLGCDLNIVEGSFHHFHEENQAIAKKALELLGFSQALIEKGLNALPPCRMERIATPYGTAILDVAHNPDGLTKLFAALGNKKYVVVVGLSKSKDCTACVRILKEHAESLHLICAKNGRGLETKALKEMFLQNSNAPKVLEHDSVESGLKSAFKECSEVVVCGTFFIMGDARQALGIHEDRDFLELN